MCCVAMLHREDRAITFPADRQTGTNVFNFLLKTNGRPHLIIYGITKGPNDRTMTRTAGECSGNQTASICDDHSRRTRKWFENVWKEYERVRKEFEKNVERVREETETNSNGVWKEFKRAQKIRTVEESVVDFGKISNIFQTEFQYSFQKFRKEFKEIRIEFERNLKEFWKSLESIRIDSKRVRKEYKQIPKRVEVDLKRIRNQF